MAEPNPERVIRVVKEAADSIVGGIGDVIMAMRDMGRAMSEIAKAVPGRDLTRVLADIATTVAGGLQVTMRSGDRSSDMFVPFESSITGTGTFDVWTPGTGRRYVLRGFAISAVNNVALLPGAAATGRFRFVDSNTTNCVAPVAVYGSTGSASAAIDFALTGTNGPVVVDLREGIRGSVVDAKLQLDCSNDIGAGVIRFNGLVWGTEATS